MSRAGSVRCFNQRTWWKLPRTHINSFSVPLSSEGRVEVLGGASLQISNLTEEDAGVYTCTADNANSTIEAQAQLTVQGTCKQEPGSQLRGRPRKNLQVQAEKEALMLTKPLNLLWI